MNRPKIVPEFYVSDIRRSIEFYVGVLGFTVRYERPEERFVYLELDGAELMIEETVDLTRTFHADVPPHPFGRGMHLQIEVADADTLYARALAARCRIVLPIEERWYRIGEAEEGNRQFVFVDPDGYLLRFWHDLGTRKSLTWHNNTIDMRKE